ncbi:MAG: Pirin, partial [uncultured Blastococcus sp.]
ERPRPLLGLAAGSRRERADGGGQGGPRAAPRQGGAAGREHPRPAAAAHPRPPDGRRLGVRRPLRPGRRQHHDRHAGRAASAHGSADRLLAAGGRGAPPRLGRQRRRLRSRAAGAHDRRTRHCALRDVAGRAPAPPARRPALGRAAGRAPRGGTALRAPRDPSGLHLRRADDDGAHGLARRCHLARHRVQPTGGRRPEAGRRGRRGAAAGTGLRVRGAGRRRLGDRRRCPGRTRLDALPGHRPADRPPASRGSREPAAARRGAVRGATGHVVELHRPLRRGDRRVRRALECPGRAVRGRRGIRRRPAARSRAPCDAAQVPRPGAV